MAYLEELVASSPHYRKHKATKTYDWYIGAWEAVDDPNAIYLKIDDDVVSGTFAVVYGLSDADNSIGLFRGQCDPSSRQTVD